MLFRLYIFVLSIFFPCFLQARTYYIAKTTYVDVDVPLNPTEALFNDRPSLAYAMWPRLVVDPFALESAIYNNIRIGKGTISFVGIKKIVFTNGYVLTHDDVVVSIRQWFSRYKSYLGKEILDIKKTAAGVDIIFSPSIYSDDIIYRFLLRMSMPQYSIIPASSFTKDLKKSSVPVIRNVRKTSIWNYEIDGPEGKNFLRFIYPSDLKKIKVLNNDMVQIPGYSPAHYPSISGLVRRIGPLLGVNVVWVDSTNAAFKDQINRDIFSRLFRSSFKELKGTYHHSIFTPLLRAFRDRSYMYSLPSKADILKLSNALKKGQPCIRPKHVCKNIGYLEALYNMESILGFKFTECKADVKPAIDSFGLKWPAVSVDDDAIQTYFTMDGFNGARRLNGNPKSAEEIDLAVIQENSLIPYEVSPSYILYAKTSNILNKIPLMSSPYGFSRFWENSWIMP